MSDRLQIEVAAGRLQPDPAQAAAARRLDELCAALRPATGGFGRFRSRIPWFGAGATAAWFAAVEILR